MDQLVLDKLPDDASHFVAVEIGDGIGDLDLLHVSASFKLEWEPVSRWVIWSPERYSIVNRERKAASGPKRGFCAAIAKRSDSASVPPPLAARWIFFDEDDCLAVASLPRLPSAQAADVADPVKEIMDATVRNWSGGDTEWIDIFDPAKARPASTARISSRSITRRQSIRQ